jgi:hypothetical protein
VVHLTLELSRQGFHPLDSMRGKGLFPKWVTSELVPERKTSDSALIRPSELERWHPPSGKKRRMETGADVYRKIKKARLLACCLDLRELMQIERKGIRFYRKYFGRRAVFGWRSAVRDRLGFRYVPYLFEFGDGVYVHWYLFDFAWKATTVWLRQRD